MTETREQFGARVLGPVLAEGALRLLMFAHALPADAQLMFCARGGLRMRRHFERFLQQIGRSSPLPCDDLMISRLAAARGPLLAQASSALDEIAREFAGSTLADAMSALSQLSLEAPSEWAAPFEIGRFLRLLNSDQTAARQSRAAIAEQANLFDRHFRSLRKREHVVLCDTGLYGSTLRLMQAAYPEIKLSCLLAARANYKGFSESHFRQTAGVLIQRNAYSPFEKRSFLLRYWQLIEHVFEPPLESVTTFALDATGEVHANLERPGWRDALDDTRDGFFAGALTYLSQLTPETYGERLSRDVPRAWSELRRRVLRPRAADTDLLDIGARGRDFGRSETVDTFDRGRRFSWASVRESLWREGAAARAPFGLRAGLQLGLEAAQIAKHVRRELAPRFRLGRSGR